MKRLLLLSVLFVFSAVLFADTLATVGDYKITDKDVKNFIDDYKRMTASPVPMTEEHALNKLIDLRLGVMDAKNQAVDTDSKAKEVMDNALYSYYMEKAVDSKYKDKKFSENEIINYYKKSPLVKIQRLTYTFNGKVQGDLEKAKAKMNLLRGELKSKKISFDAAIEKTQERSIPALTGTFDKLLIDDLAPQEMVELKPLKPLEISSIIQGAKFLAITRILTVYPYSPEYSEDIANRMRIELIMSARNKFSTGLRQKYAALIQMN